MSDSELVTSSSAGGLATTLTSYFDKHKSHGFDSLHWIGVGDLGKKVFDKISSTNHVVSNRMVMHPLIVPSRDGMNLVAKEYVASREAVDGVLILSETAGASCELKEAVLVNANDAQEVADAIVMAMVMTKTEQRYRIGRMQKHLSTNYVEAWAEGFIRAIETTKSEIEQMVKLPMEVFMSDLEISQNVFAYFVLPLLIFFARISEVWVNTIRIIYMLEGRRYTATILGFFEALIWVIAMRQVFQHLYVNAFGRHYFSVSPA